MENYVTLETWNVIFLYPCHLTLGCSAAFPLLSVDKYGIVNGHELQVEFMLIFYLLPELLMAVGVIESISVQAWWKENKTKSPKK